MVEIRYDPHLLAIEPPAARCIVDRGRYSIWNKPPGLLSQGNEWADHCSLLRQVETAFNPSRPVYPVHRLDREAGGLLVVAHDGDAAAKLSLLFQQSRVTKRYRVRVKGDLAAVMGESGEIDTPIDGKAARTRYRAVGYDPASDSSICDVELLTGRLHQIRRHFEQLGFPVIGDPRYGKGNKDMGGLRLRAVHLAFECPLSGERVEACLSDDEARV